MAYDPYENLLLERNAFEKRALISEKKYIDEHEDNTRLRNEVKHLEKVIRDS